MTLRAHHPDWMKHARGALAAVASRAEAIERAVELGLLEDSRYPARADAITSR